MKETEDPPIGCVILFGILAIIFVCWVVYNHQTHFKAPAVPTDAENWAEVRRQMGLK